MPDEVQPETKDLVPVMEPSTAEEGPGAPVIVDKEAPPSVTKDEINSSNADYNAGIAEYGNSPNFCEAVHGKKMVDAVQKDGYVSMKVVPLD